MTLYTLVLLSGIIFLAAYFTYGRFLRGQFDLKSERKTPASLVNDGVDFVPTQKGFLLGQHFSAIAAAGPIVGPIIAAIWFGWLPVLLWIVFGAIFLGAVHDFSSLAGSVKHGATSIVEMVKELLGRRGHLFFLVFVWLSLMYVITAFTDLTSGSFVDPELGGGVASSSTLYLVIGLIMGLALRFLKMPLGIATLFFLALVVLSIWLGPFIPLRIPDTLPLSPKQIWNIILLLYCLIASVIPVWLLLQPRGYLGGFFLYGTLALGLVGLFIGGEKITYPAFLGFVNPKGLPLFPILFVTVACGACSGFHGIVSSGTTSKQIEKEPDCHAVGYGGMLLEGLVAVLALATVMVLAKSDVLASSSPDRIYAEGLSRFVQHLGIPKAIARSFTLLAFTTFIYDTLDVSTRLARYLLEELTGWKGLAGNIASGICSLAIPFFCVLIQMVDESGQAVPAWKIFWTIFGTSNQLLAALTLLVLSLWLKKTGKLWWMSGIPAIFMMTVTLSSLVLLVMPAFQHVGNNLKPFPALSGVTITALLLFALALLLICEVLKKWPAVSVKPNS